MNRRVHQAIGKQNAKRMKRGLRHGKNPDKVLHQARISARDFEPFYGDPLSDLERLKQADFTTSSTGLLNRIFGNFAWSQLQDQTPTFDSLPKINLGPNTPLGWRAKTAFADTGKGGQSEGTIPTAITGTYAEVSPTPKETTTKERVSGLHQDMSAIDDTILGAVSEIQQDTVIEHANQMERALTEDVDTTAGNNLESIDRVSADENNQSTIGYDAGDDDIFGIDRSANAWSNGQQVGAGTASGLTKGNIKQVFRQVVAERANPTYWLTGYDTWEAIDDLYDAQGRYEIGVSELSSQGQQEDAEAMEGLAVATFIGRLFGRVVIASDEVQTDSNEISRLYLHDVSNPEGASKPRMGIDVIRPTQVFVTGEKSDQNPDAIGFLGDSVVVNTRAELGCRAFHKQGQVRDRTAP